MIQLIINTEVNVKALMELEDNGLAKFQCATIPEMDNGWLILINEKDDFDAIEQAIEDLGDVEIVGSYNMDGSQFIWINPNSNRNHTITKYKNKLNPKEVWNEQSQDYDYIPYTEITALEKQVNLVYGHPKRNLE